jgi:hypothetical protein
MKPKVKNTILEYLKNRQGDFGETIEAYCAGVCRVKNSNVGRRLRELENSGAIVAEYVKLPNVPNKVVYYKLKEHKADMFQRRMPTPLNLFRKLYD